jgi:hypothetical protein
MLLAAACAVSLRLLGPLTAEVGAAAVAAVAAVVAACG